MIRSFDYPPIWLLGFCIVAYILRGVLGFEPTLLLLWVGGGIAFVGVALQLWAALTMMARKTTFIPHRSPQFLVTTGPFRLSRNPIYLGDVFTLAGVSLLFGSWVGLACVPVFAIILDRRFIRPEEQKLVAGFPEEFAKWAKRTGRWL
ncbi:isoprenylcysteine carboxylmethyltransferase family protein [Celeribacter arenosi]|uniref:Isoprenylcysteine carboxylmethyltransferase family protein n=1 Tax=Celeribacter arenosi TaxID=792649 RepID=A0ABP7KCC4_9RHOB